MKTFKLKIVFYFHIKFELLFYKHYQRELVTDIKEKMLFLFSLSYHFYLEANKSNGKDSFGVYCI